MTETVEDDGPDSEQAIRQHLAAMIARYLLGKGIHDRKQAAHVAEITGLSIMHARRKLAGSPSWSIEECLALTQHHGDTLNEMLSPDAQAVGVLTQSCEVKIGRHWYAASAAFGPVVPHPRTGELMAYQTARSWRVAPHDRESDNGPCYEVVQLDVRSSACANVHIAVLDDDVSVANTVRDGLISAGFAANAFTCPDEVNAAIGMFDVFIIDFFLGDERTATPLIQSIRHVKPDALIIVLTGHAREGADEELARQIRMFKVQMFEKPARIAYFESAVEGWMDQVQRP